MTEHTHALQVSQVNEHCKALRLPTVAGSFEGLATEAIKGGHTHLQYLEALLSAEVQERESGAIARKLREARLPRVKTLAEFDFNAAPKISATEIKTLASGGYLERCEPVIFLGDCGTGKTHIATSLCVAACHQRKRVRFTTAAGLVNELLEAQHENQLGRALARWSRYDLVCIDELGYVPLAELGAELLFQVISERAEKASVMITTNLPFSEWTKVFANARLCKAILDRLTDRANIILTGPDSYRFRRTMERRGGAARVAEASRYASQASEPSKPETEEATINRSTEASRYDSQASEPSKPEAEEATTDKSPEASRDASGSTVTVRPGGNR